MQVKSTWVNNNNNISQREFTRAQEFAVEPRYNETCNSSIRKRQIENTIPFRLGSTVLRGLSLRVAIVTVARKKMMH